MTIDLTETTTGAIDHALTAGRQRLGGLDQRHGAHPGHRDRRGAQYDAMRAANEAAREHPCRILGGDHPAGRRRTPGSTPRSGSARPARARRSLLRMYGPLGQHADSVVAPLLVPDTPVVTWWPGEAPEVPAKRPARRARPAAGHRRGGRRRPRECADARSRRPTSRATPTSAGPGPRRGGRCSPPRSTSRTRTVQRARSRAEADNPSADLIAAWLAARLRRPGGQRGLRRPGHHRGQLRHQRGRHQRSPGRTAGAALLAGPASPTARWRCTAGTPRNCWRRNCAGWTPTRCTREIPAACSRAGQ